MSFTPAFTFLVSHFIADIALDMDGYKQSSHERETSDQTIRSSKTDEDPVPFPLQEPRKRTHHSPILPHTQSNISTPYAVSPSPSPSPSDSPSLTASHSPAHLLRATSEPPPQIEVEDDKGLVLTIPTTSHSLPEPVQEYSWEWGAFPQPSPMKATFGKGGRLEPPKPAWRSSGKTGRKGRLSGMTLPPVKIDEEPTMSQIGGSSGRSRSVPPQLDGSPKKGRREYKEYEDVDDEEEEPRGRAWGGFRVDRKYLTPVEEQGEEFSKLYGRGGALSASRDDPTLFVLTIEGKKVGFQLSLVPENESDQNGGMTVDGLDDDVGTAGLFDRYRVDLERFLDDESVVEDPRLVIRWAGEQYVWFCLTA